MGFSTSGSIVLVFAGLLVAMGSLYTATANTAERMAEATGDQQDHFRTIQETQINVTSAVWNDTEANLTVRTNNTGETTLSANETDVLVDGAYVGLSEFERREVAGSTTDVWRPGAQFVLEDDDTLTSTPERVKVVTGPGVADTAPVEVVS